MPNLSLITIAGHIGGDAETRPVQTQRNETTVTSFSVAVNNRDDTTTWYRVSVWGNYGVTLEPYLTKGAIVTVIGDFQPRAYIDREGNDRYSFDIKANNVIVASGGTRETEAELLSSGAMPADEDIPF